MLALLVAFLVIRLITWPLRLALRVFSALGRMFASLSRSADVKRAVIVGAIR